MPVNGYSTYASYISNVNSFKRLQTSLAELTQQLNSGKKSSESSAGGRCSSGIGACHLKTGSAFTANTRR